MNSGISLRNISHFYAEKDILTEISLDISQGDVSILRGPSGCGKSTFLRILAGLDTPSSGTIHYNDISTQDVLFPSFYRDNIGVFFTDSVFFESSTARENILFPSVFGKYRFSKYMFDSCIKGFEIDDILDTPVFRLSSGERERVAFVRMLVADPSILILDEPFSHLDERLYTRALEFLSEYVQNNTATLWVVTHDRDFILPGASEYRIDAGNLLLI